MTKIKDVIASLEEVAPRGLQESYDNSGLLTGDPSDEVTGALITLDTTEQVVQEAIDSGCNLIISHHPIIFKGLKSLTGKNYVERTVIMAIRHKIAIYAIHTNLDNVRQGVNMKIAEKIGLQKLSILSPKKGALRKLVTFVPLPQKDAVTEALWNAGAGNIGNYDQCSFQIKGTGTFRPNEEANPSIGTALQYEQVTEVRLEVLVPAVHEKNILNALKESHPYEEVAYYLSAVENENQDVGAGMIGELPEIMEPDAFLALLKNNMELTTIRHTKPVGKYVKKIAVCGGSGSFLLEQAKRSSADVFITADMKYHEFFDAEDALMIADIGHYESEVFTKELIYDILSKKFTKFALQLSRIVTNPISYL